MIHITDIEAAIRWKIIGERQGIMPQRINRTDDAGGDRDLHTIIMRARQSNKIRALDDGE